MITTVNASGTRRQSREVALQILFQQEFSPQQDVQSALENFRKSFDTGTDVWSYALQLLRGVNSQRKEIDGIIQKCSAHWTLKRMALVDLNIMRMSVYEMRFAAEIIPPAVAINEAVEIAKKFGTVDSAAFVNGILDQVVKE